MAIAASWDWPLIHDAATNHYIADQILKGATPYRDIFDMNLPGSYIPHLICLFVFGESDFAWRFVDMLFMLLAAWSLWRICKSQNEQVAIFCACAVLLFHIGNGSVFSGQRDWWLASLILASGVFLLRALEEKVLSYDNLLFMSIFAGAAASIKPFALLFLPLSLALYLSRIKKKKNWLKLFSSIIFGFAFVPFCLVLWLLLSGGFEAFLDILNNYSWKIYSAVKIPSSFDALMPFGKILGALALFSGIVVLTVRKFQYAPRHILVLVAGCLYGLFHFLFQAKGWSYHAYPLLVFLIPLVILWLDSLGKNRRRPKQALVPFLLLVTICFGLALRGISRSMGDESLEYIKPYVPELISDLESLNLDDQAPVQVMDTALGGLHALFRTSLKQSSRTVYDFHFQVETGHPYVERMKNEFIDELEDKNPQAVVVFRAGWLAPHDYSRHEQFPEFLAYLKNGYRLEKETDEYRLYLPVSE